MKSGRKLKTIEEKQLLGTVQPCRDAKKAVLAIVPSNAPAPPVWLTANAKAVWTADLPRAMAMGLADVDQSMFALYCETLASFIAAIQSGTTPNAAFRSELRKQMELLGIAGAKSRLTKIETNQPAKASPFAIMKGTRPK